jgi:hypothetical protein
MYVLFYIREHSLCTSIEQSTVLLVPLSLSLSLPPSHFNLPILIMLIGMIAEICVSLCSPETTNLFQNITECICVDWKVCSQGLFQYITTEPDW